MAKVESCESCGDGPNHGRGQIHDAEAPGWHDKTFGQQITHFVARLFFRGIYFPQMSKAAWLKLLLVNSGTILTLILEGFRVRKRARRNELVEEGTRETPVVLTLGSRHKTKVSTD